MRLFFLAISCSLLAIGCRSYPSDQKDIVELRQEILDWEEYSFLNDADLKRLEQENSDLKEALKNQNQETIEPQSEAGPIQNKTGQSDSTQPRPDSATIGQVTYNAAIPTLAAPEPALKIRKAESISVYSPPTTGVNLDEIEGDEGVEIFITPQDDLGETVHCDGELTVSLIDPTATPEQQRIGLWKFVSEETKLFFAKDTSGERGILLHLPWEQSIPINSSLDLHVRLVTPDGRTLKTKHQLTITPPDAEYSVDNSGIRRWTREDPRWLPASGEPEVVEQIRKVPNSTPDKIWKPSKKQPAKAKKAEVKKSPPPQVNPPKPVWSPIRR
jgi:hypothetical protein